VLRLALRLVRPVEIVVGSRIEYEGFVRRNPWQVGHEAVTEMNGILDEHRE
jgi:hypothetical protein